MAHAATHDPAQHIAASLVRGQHAVGNQERSRAHMIGDHAMAEARLAFALGARSFDRGRDQMAEEVDVVIVGDALKDRADALEPHSGVDRRPRQVDARFLVDLFELHEDKIPELEEAIAFLVGRSGRAALDGVALVVEDLRIVSARPKRAHRPQIALVIDDALVGETRDLLPEPACFLVCRIDGNPKAVFRKARNFANVGPGVFDRRFLEIVAEREIPQHLEKGVVARRVADIVEIIVLAAGAHAFLHAGCPRVGALFRTR